MTGPTAQPERRWPILVGTAALLAACAAFTAAVLATTPVIRVTLQSGYDVLVYRSPRLLAARWALVAGGLALAGGAALATRAHDVSHRNHSR